VIKPTEGIPNSLLSFFKVTTLNKIIIITLITLLLTISCAAAVEYPITDLNAIDDFPSPIVAGDMNTAKFTFTGTYDTNITINFTVSSSLPIGYNEWQALFFLDEQILIPTEEPSGTFLADTSINTSSHELVIIYIPLSYIVPDNYSLSLSFSAMIEEDAPTPAPTKSSDGGSSRAWYRSNPTTTPTPTVNVTVTEPATATVTETAIAIDRPTEHPHATPTETESSGLPITVGTLVTAVGIAYLVRRNE